MSHVNPWYPAAKLGIFVHWGVFATMFAENERDGLQNRQLLTEEEYVKRARLFTGTQFDADKWAAQFERWGARYAVLTTRHSQGFALWDTQVDDWSIVKQSPYGRDVVAQWSEALRRRGLKVGLYMSHRDWHDPDFRKVMNGALAAQTPPEELAAAWERYIDRRDRKITELLENYGKIDLMWLDEDWGRNNEQLRSEDLIDRIETRQPRIVVNDRFCHQYIGHYGTPEQYVPINTPGALWEVCDTLVDSPHWQHVEGERRYKRAGDVLRFFIDVLCAGCNYLINVGPTPEGEILAREAAILDKLGDFCRTNAEAIYGTGAGLPRGCFGGGSTVKGNAIYLFAQDRPRGELAVRGLKNKIIRVTELATGEQLPFRHSGGRSSHGMPGYLWIDAPAESGPDPIVYKVEFEGKRPEISQR